MGLVFLASGILKLTDPVAFYTNLQAYSLGGPDWFYRVVAVVLPWVEVLSGALLLAAVWTETVAAVVAGLCAIFVAALGQALARGLELKCGCFGGLAPSWLETPGVALVRASLLLVATVWLLWRSSASRGTETISVESILTPGHARPHSP